MTMFIPPPQLAVAGEPGGEGTHVGEHLRDRQPHDQLRQRPDRRDGDLVAPPHGERETEAVWPPLVRTVT
jgi:hypothetical protein